MAGTLRSNPVSDVWWRGVTSERLYMQYVWLSNSGPDNLIISVAAFTTGTKYIQVIFPFDSLPLTITPGANVLMLILFNPVTADEDTTLTDTLTLTHDGTNSPYAFSLSAGVRRSDLGPQIVLSPSSWQFNWTNSRNLLAGISIGERSNVANINIYNGGTELLEIYDIVALWPFQLVEPLPVLPAVLASGISMVFHLVCYPNVVGDTTYSRSLEIISNAVDIPVLFYVMGVLGVAVTSAHNLAGTARTALAGLGSTILQFAPNDLNVETTARLVKHFDFSLPHMEKTLLRIRSRYEDLGAATYNQAIKSRDATPTPNPNPVSIGTGAADEFIREALSDLDITEQIIKWTLTHAAGPLSFVDFAFDIEPQGPVVD